MKDEVEESHTRSISDLSGCDSLTLSFLSDLKWSCVCKGKKKNRKDREQEDYGEEAKHFVVREKDV